MSFRVVFVLLLAATFMSCSSEDERTDPSADTATTGSFELVADETLKPAIDSLVFGFNSIYKEAKVTVRYKNSSEALDDLLQNRARLVIIGRALTSRERELLKTQTVELPEFEIALNPIACIVNSSSSIDSLSVEDLSQDIAGISKKYLKVIGSSTSSTQAILDSFFQTEDQGFKGRILQYQSTDSIIQKISSDVVSIGFISACWLTKAPNVKAIDISYKGKTALLHLAYVYQGIYPLVGRVMAYTNEPPNTLPRGFLAYAMHADGQRVFLNHNLLPRTQIIKLTPPPVE